MSIHQVNFLVSAPSGPLRVVELSSNRDSGDRLGLDQSRTIALSLVVPTYNESENIAALIDQLSHLLDQTIPGSYELIVVDDDSPDYTWKVAHALASQYPHLRVMRRQHERGLSTAVIRGWQVAEGEILGVIDGDLQHPPETLLQLLAEMNQGADLAVASRHVEGGGVSNWSVIRRLLSRGAQLLGLVVLPQVVGRVSDPMSGYFMVRRSAIAAQTLSPTGYKILIEVLGRGTIGQVAEVGYVFQERQGGESKVTWKQYVDYILHLLKLRFRRNTSLHQRKGHAHLPPPLNFPIERFIRFGLVGLSGVFVDMTIFYLLGDPSTLGWDVTWSKIVAAEFAILNNFCWNDRWTFSDISNQQQGWRPRIIRLFKFNAVCLIGLMLNVVLLNLFFKVLGINQYIANLLAIAAVTLWNFWINLKLNWRVTQVNK